MLKETMILYGIYFFYIGERGIELLINKKNFKYLMSKFFIIKKYSDESLQMKLFHSSWFLFLFIELSLHGKLISGPLLYFSIVLLFFAQILRWSAILTLGHYWSIDIYEMKTHPIIYRGPYKILPHPNYLAVILEFIFLPLILGCPLTMVVGTFINTLILHRRISLEEHSLDEQSKHAYSGVFFN